MFTGIYLIRQSDGNHCMGRLDPTGQKFLSGLILDFSIRPGRVDKTHRLMMDGTQNTVMGQKMAQRCRQSDDQIPFIQ